VDPSTLRFAVGILRPEALEAHGRTWYGLDMRVASVHTALRTLQASSSLALRQVMAVDTLTDWLRALEAEHGRPEKIGLEIPLGPTVPLESFYVIGAFYVAVGEVWGGGGPEVVGINAGEHKKASTGVGRDHPHRAPKQASRAQREQVRRQNRRHELDRIVRWAQSIGYAGEQEDEAAALSVAVAVALGRRRGRGRK
jgi:hypothetical protein